MPGDEQYVAIAEKHSYDKLEWDFMDHLSGNHSASRSANRIWNLHSIEGKLSLSSTS
jgi:hypothetical protein